MLDINSIEYFYIFSSYIFVTPDLEMSVVCFQILLYSRTGVFGITGCSACKRVERDGLFGNGFLLLNKHIILLAGREESSNGNDRNIILFHSLNS